MTVCAEFVRRCPYIAPPSFEELFLIVKPYIVTSSVSAVELLPSKNTAPP